MTSSKTPEGKVKDKIKKILKANNVYYTMPMGTGFGSAGVPDFLCCVHGFFIGIEAKANGNKTTALQDKNMADIERSGGIALVIDENNLGDIELHINMAKSLIPELVQAPCAHEWIDGTKSKPTWRCAKCGEEYAKEQP
jgi:hypothetical protein